MFPNFPHFVLTRLVASVLGGLLVGGCSMSPTYERPSVTLPSTLGQMQAGLAARAGASITLSKQERAFLHEFSPDHDLTPLVTRALGHNADYRLAVLRVEQARAQYRIERSTPLPTVGIEAQKMKRVFGNPMLDERYQQNIVSAGVGIDNFELDFFGRLKSLSEAAQERYLASNAGSEAARGAVIAEVLRAYTLDCVAIRVRDQLQAVDSDSAELLTIAKQQTEVGLLSADELERRGIQADHAHVAALQAVDDARAAQRALQLLAGYDTRVAACELASLADAPVASSALGDLESKILLRRPDIRQAEAELRAANADIGAARAAFFPSIRLSTSLGSASGSLDGLFGGGSRTWSFMPQLVLPIFDAGRNRANLDLAWTRKQAGVAEYEKVIESAFREVADALDARETLITAEARLRQQDRVAELRIKREASRVARGLGDRQDLIADRADATQITIDYLQAQRNLALNRVALFHAFYGIKLPIRF